VTDASRACGSWSAGKQTEVSAAGSVAREKDRVAISQSSSLLMDSRARTAVAQMLQCGVEADLEPNPCPVGAGMRIGEAERGGVANRKTTARSVPAMEAEDAGWWYVDGCYGLSRFPQRLQVMLSVRRSSRKDMLDGAVLVAQASGEGRGSRLGKA
jgi:hypothetical protein